MHVALTTFLHLPVIIHRVGMVLLLPVVDTHVAQVRIFEGVDPKPVTGLLGVTVSCFCHTWVVYEYL